MLPANVQRFVSSNHSAVLTTFRKNGAAQMSIVTAGPFRDGVAFTTTADRAKLHNLRRDPRCSLMVAEAKWSSYVVLEGRAEIMSPGATDAEELRLALREVYRAAAGKEHPGWEEYDKAMIDEHRSVVLVLPDHTYGTAL
jgi:PPOX class probable F420-dependent enzyme